MEERPEQVRDLLLLTLGITSGAVDAISWFGLEKVFSAFMTGNIAFLGFNLGGGDEPPVVRVLVALAAFSIGAFLGGRLIGREKLNGVWSPRVTAALAVSVAADLVFAVFWIVVGGEPAKLSGDFLIAISAIAMGIQTVAVFALGIRAAFTTAATATIAILMGDFSDWSLSQRERLRLAAVIVAIIVGAALGTLLIRHARTEAPLLPLATAALTVAIARSVFNRRGQLRQEAPGA